jgi:hypothetical protein
MQDHDVQVMFLDGSSNESKRILRQRTLRRGGVIAWNPRTHRDTSTIGHGMNKYLFYDELMVTSKAFFADGLGGAKLEYTLIGCAVRLAYARGIHLHPTSRSVSFEQSERRSWLFWTLYCFEKHLTMRAGRPSVSSTLSLALSNL